MLIADKSGRDEQDEKQQRGLPEVQPEGGPEHPRDAASFSADKMERDAVHGRRGCADGDDRKGENEPQDIQNHKICDARKKFPERGVILKEFHEITSFAAGCGNELCNII